MTRRTERLNSLLREVISDVINKEVNNPQVAEFVSVTSVEITKDLHHAKVYISVIGSDKEKSETIDALNQAAGYIGTHASKQVTMRYFPVLRFYIDESADKHLRINSILDQIEEENQSRVSDSVE